MANVILVAYLLIVLALIAVILVQRSEGGGLGIGGGTAGGMMTARGSANLLTRTTAILAALFMATAVGLTLLNEVDRGSSSILDQAVQGASGTAAGSTTTQQPKNVLDALNKLQGTTDGSASTTTAPATDSTSTGTSSSTTSTTTTTSGSSNKDGLSLPVPSSSTDSGTTTAPATGN